MQDRQDVADQLIQDVQDVEVMLVHQLDVVTEHIFVFVHQAALMGHRLVTLERHLEHIVDVQLTHVDVYKGQLLQFVVLTAAAQEHQCVQVPHFN